MKCQKPDWTNFVVFNHNTQLRQQLKKIDFRQNSVNFFWNIPYRWNKLMHIDSRVAVATRTSVAALVAVDPTVDYSWNALKTLK